MTPFTNNRFEPYLGISAALFSTLFVVYIGWHTGLFWDNILFVRVFGHALSSNGFFAWGSIPTPHDPGHPMLTATYLSIIWSIWGETLSISHIAMIPFIFFFYYTLWSITKLLFRNSKWALLAYVLILSDPTIFSQLMYIGPEVLILCFVSITIYGILKPSPWLQVIGLMLLGITTLRGMMLCAGIFLWDICRHSIVKKGSILSFFSVQKICIYIIGALPAVTFIAWRLLTKGWITSNPLASWGNAFGYENIIDFSRNFLWNSIVLATRIVDFGRIIPAGMVFILLITTRKKWFDKPITTDLLLFTTTICSIVAIMSLVIINPMGHSYFLCIYIGMELLLISLLKDIKWRKQLYTCALSALLLGNLIVYPERISQGWSCSLASLPYWSLRSQMFAYMDEKHILPQETLTFFPFGKCADDVDFQGDTRKYACSWEDADYVLTSNICNLDDETLEKLHNYTIVKCLKKRGVYLKLYSITP